MAEKLSDKLKKLFSKERGAPKGAVYPTQFEKKAFEAGQKTTAFLKGKKMPSLKTTGRLLSRAALPVAAAFEIADVGYQLATRTPEQKARTKKLKAKLKKTSTKDYHSDLLKMSVGGDTMLKNPKKADLDKDGKLSSYEKKRGKAIEANMKAKKGKMMYASMGMEAKSTRGYGAARTSGMGLQDEQLVPGKSLDYYKDLM